MCVRVWECIINCFPRTCRLIHVPTFPSHMQPLLLPEADFEKDAELMKRLR